MFEANRSCIWTSDECREVKPVRPNLPLIGAILFLASGLGLIIGYSQGTTSMNMGYPIAASTLQIAITTTGPAVVGGLCLTAIGLLLMILALILAILGELGLIGPSWYSQAESEQVERPKRLKWFEKSK
jgi:hypothetical protein